MPGASVVLIHGLWMTGFELAFLQRRLRAVGYRVTRFRYRMVTRSLDYNRKRLRRFVTELHGRHAVPVHFVGHSLGGVLALHTLRAWPDLPVGRVVCLGSPLVDTSAGRVLHDYSAATRAILGKTLPEAIFHAPLGRWDGPQEVGVVAGTRGVGMGKYVADLPKPNDGVVAVAETRLPGIADRFELPVGHTRLVISQEVARQCDRFLRTGRFDHAGEV